MNSQMLAAMADEIEKIALDSDLKKKRNRELVAKYMGLGAAVGPIVGMIHGAIAGGGDSWKGNLFGRSQPARKILAGSIVGALTSGAIPLVRGKIDKATRKKYQHMQETRDFAKFMRYFRSQRGSKKHS